MENLGAPAERFAECGSAYGHNHKFLRIDGVCSVSAAVENVHHRNRQLCALNSAEELVQRKSERACRRS